MADTTEWEARLYRQIQAIPMKDRWPEDDIFVASYEQRSKRRAVQLRFMFPEAPTKRP